MSRPIIFMFSGQGSHYYQMGRELYENNPVFKTWILKIGKLVQKLIGQSIVNLLYYDGFKKSDVFNRTLYTHPSIFMVEYALSQVLLDKGIVPDGVLGASLGEFTSAAFTGVMSLEDTIYKAIPIRKVILS